MPQRPLGHGAGHFEQHPGFGRCSRGVQTQRLGPENWLVPESQIGIAQDDQIDRGLVVLHPGPVGQFRLDGTQAHTQPFLQPPDRGVICPSACPGGKAVPLFVGVVKSWILRDGLILGRGRLAHREGPPQIRGQTPGNLLNDIRQQCGAATLPVGPGVISKNFWYLLNVWGGGKIRFLRLEQFPLMG